MFSGRLTAALAADNRSASRRPGSKRQGLLAGATLRAGRFLSSIGYLNDQHAHTWDFVDAPLAYQAFFGGPYQDRRPAAALAGADRPLPRARRGDRRGHELPGQRPRPQRRSARRRSSRTSATTSASARAGALGASFLHTAPAIAPTTTSNAAGTAVTNAFTGTSRTWVLDAIYKWAPGGKRAAASLKSRASTSGAAKAAP